jgi:hypothetical protein
MYICIKPTPLCYAIQIYIKPTYLYTFIKPTAIVAALLEIQQFVVFIVGDSCDGINIILEEFLDPLLDGDDVCFDVVATLKDVSASSRCPRLSPLLQYLHTENASNLFPLFPHHNIQHTTSFSPIIRHSTAG